MSNMVQRKKASETEIIAERKKFAGLLFVGEPHGIMTAMSTRTNTVKTTITLNY